MVNDYFDISDKLLESNKVGRTFCKKGRLVLGFKTLQRVTVNGSPYNKIKGIDIDINTHKVELGTDKESIKLRFNEFDTVKIDENLNIVIE